MFVYMEHLLELLYPSGAPAFIPGFSGIRVTWSLILCFFLLVIVLSVHLRFTDCDYPFGILKLFLLPTGSDIGHIFSKHLHCCLFYVCLYRTFIGTTARWSLAWNLNQTYLLITCYFIYLLYMLVLTWVIPPRIR